MPDAYIPKYYYIDEIIINAIVFDETENLTLLGSYYNTDEEKLNSCDYLCDFAQLTDLLLIAGEHADKIITELTDKLCGEFEIPSVLDIKEIIGEPLKIEGIMIKIYKPHDKNDDGEWVPINEPLYIIDDIESKEAFEQSPEGKQYLFKQEISKYLSILNIAFRYYEQLVAMKFPDKKARKKAGLKDELLFRIAYFNSQINKT